MIPSPAELTYFLEVATSLNLSRAAERLGLSQPSLSLAMQRLEGAIGTPLLIRGKRGVTLTQAGKQLVTQARDLLQSWDQVRRKARATVDEIEGHYTLGCHVSVALYSMPQTLGRILEAHPRLEIKLIHDLSRRIAERVIKMEVDLGLVINPVRHDDLIIRKVGDDQVTFFTGPGSRKVQDTRSGDAVLICDPDLLQTQELVRKMKSSGLRFRRIIETSSLEVITQLTAEGAGIGVLPTRVAAQSRALKPIPKAPVFNDHICLLYRIENKSVKSIQLLAHALEKGL